MAMVAGKIRSVLVVEKTGKAWFFKIQFHYHPQPVTACPGKTNQPGKIRFRDKR
jgi:hypothetical protein